MSDPIYSEFARGLDNLHLLSENSYTNYMLPVNLTDESPAPASTPGAPKDTKVLPIVGGIILIIVLLGGAIFAWQYKGIFLSGSSSGTGMCAEDQISSISAGFASAESATTIPVFETIFEVPRTGAGSGYINGSGESDIWVADGKLAYVVTYFKEANTHEDVLYYDGKEKERVYLQFITPIQTITDRLAYYTKNKIVFGDDTYPFPQLATVTGAEAIDGKLYIHGSGGAYYNGEKLSEDKNIFSLDGHMAEFKTTSLGMRTVTYRGQTSEVPNQKYTFVYGGKEYATEYDGFTGEGAVLCNDKPAYAVKEGLNLYVDENYREYVVYDGKIVGRSYFSILKTDIIGGDIVYLSMKEKGDAPGVQTKIVLVKNGVEIGTEYDSVQDFFSHNGHLVYVGVDLETLTGMQSVGAGGRLAQVTSTSVTYYVVQDGQVIYKTAPGEYIVSVEGRSPEVISVGSKLALLTRGGDMSQKRVMYDGVEVMSQYAGAISKIFDWNGKLAALVDDGNKSFIVVEGSRTEQVAPQTSSSAEKSPIQDIFDLLSKGTPLEGRTLSASDDDFLDGGADEDTAIYSGQHAAYELYRGNDLPSRNADNTVFVVDERNGSIDTLVNMERIDFADQLISLPDFKVLSTKVVPIGFVTASLRAKERIAVQNQMGRTVSVIPVSITPTTVTMSVIFESATQKLLSVAKGGNDIVVLGEDANAPRLSVSVGAIQGDVATLTLTMTQ